MHEILITGGAGYIGSHTIVQLLNADYKVIVIDNLINGSLEALKRVEQITNKEIIFYQGDIRDTVIHFAGLKAVGESSKIPLEYYDVNFSGTVALCKVMDKFGVRKLVFSSSATVYGDSVNVPFSEKHPTQKPTNPYGYSKLMVEEILQDLVRSDSRWSTDH